MENKILRTRFWQKHTLTQEFLSESCCFADIDSDGAIELIAGGSWWRLDGSGSHYQFRDIIPTWLPDWPHVNRQDPYPHLRKGGGPPQYRNSTYDFPVDLMGSGRPDIIWVGMHKDPIVWCENAGELGQNWPVHVLTQGGVYESVICTDLLGNGKQVLVTVPCKPYVAWYEPGQNPRHLWQAHLVGKQGGDWHGLGVGDIDGDGRNEILTKNLYYYQGRNPREPWHWKRLEQLTEDGQWQEGLGDVFRIEVVHFTSHDIPHLISASPHRFGLWWWEFLEETPTARRYRRHTIYMGVTQLHAIRVASLQKETPPAILCGKRWQAHGPTGDVCPEDPSVLLAFQAYQNSWENSVPELIDEDSGVGIHFDVCRDINGDVIVAVSNKKGVHVFTQNSALL